MRTTTPSKDNYLLGGVVLCAFPVVLLLAMHINGSHLPMPWPILFGVFFIHGLRAVITSLFRLDIDGPVSWATDAVGAGGFALFAFWIAGREKGGWNAGFVRILIALGGLMAALFAARCLWKAFNQSRGKRDDGVRHQ
jgi:hypothetical protein